MLTCIYRDKLFFMLYCIPLERIEARQGKIKYCGQCLTKVQSQQSINCFKSASYVKERHATA